MSTDNSSHHNSPRSVIRSTSILSLGTLASRILGFVRDVVLARMLGTGFKADAFFVALRIPNLLRDLVGEGASNAAIVPVLMEYKTKREAREFWQVVSSVLVLGLMGLSVLTVLGIWLSPVIVRVIAPGFWVSPEKFLLTVRLTKIMFPYLVLIGLTAHSMAVLYVFRAFITPAFGPCLLNLAMIAGALVGGRYFEEPVFAIALGVLIGGVLQLAFQFIPLLRKDAVLRWPRPLVHPGAIQIGRLLLPRMAGTAVYELNLVVDTFYASLSAIVGLGGISAIYYANRIVQFPMGIFGFALSSASLPTLSALASEGRLEEFKRMLLFSLENILFLMAPAGIVMLVLGEPVIRILFQRGAFDTYSTIISSTALFFYALGLLSFGGIKLLGTAFYALQDTRTPVKTAAWCLGINFVLNLLLMFPMKVAGLALASSIAATVNFGLLLVFMEKRVGIFRAELRGYLFKILSAGLLTGIILALAWNVFTGREVIKFFILAPLSCVAYLGFCVMLKVEHAGKLVRWIARR